MFVISIQNMDIQDHRNDWSLEKLLHFSDKCSNGIYHCFISQMSMAAEYPPLLRCGLRRDKATRPWPRWFLKNPSEIFAITVLNQLCQFGLIRSTVFLGVALGETEILYIFIQLSNVIKTGTATIVFLKHRPRHRGHLCSIFT